MSAIREPLQILIVYDSPRQYPELADIHDDLISRYRNCRVRNALIDSLAHELELITPQQSYIVLLLTKQLKLSAELTETFVKMSNTYYTRVIMYPRAVPKLENVYYTAPTKKDIYDSINGYWSQNYKLQTSKSINMIGVRKFNAESTSLQHIKVLMISMFTSSNQDFNYYMNNIYLKYKSEGSMRFQQIKYAQEVLNRPPDTKTFLIVNHTESEHVEPYLDLLHQQSIVTVHFDHSVKTANQFYTKRYKINATKLAVIEEAIENYLRKISYSKNMLSSGNEYFPQPSIEKKPSIRLPSLRNNLHLNGNMGDGIKENGNVISKSLSPASKYRIRLESVKKLNFTPNKLGLKSPQTAPKLFVYDQSNNQAFTELVQQLGVEYTAVSDPRRTYPDKSILLCPYQKMRAVVQSVKKNYANPSCIFFGDSYSPDAIVANPSIDLATFNPQEIRQYLLSHGLVCKKTIGSSKSIHRVTFGVNSAAETDQQNYVANRPTPGSIASQPNRVEANLSHTDPKPNPHIQPLKRYQSLFSQQGKVVNKNKSQEHDPVLGVYSIQNLPSTAAPSAMEWVVITRGPKAFLTLSMQNYLLGKHLNSDDPQIEMNLYSNKSVVKDENRLPICKFPTSTFQPIQNSDLSYRSETAGFGQTEIRDYSTSRAQSPSPNLANVSFHPDATNKLFQNFNWLVFKSAGPNGFRTINQDQLENLAPEERPAFGTPNLEKMTPSKQDRSSEGHTISDKINRFAPPIITNPARFQEALLTQSSPATPIKQMDFSPAVRDGIMRVNTMQYAPSDTSSHLMNKKISNESLQLGSNVNRVSDKQAKYEHNWFVYKPKGEKKYLIERDYVQGFENQGLPQISNRGRHQRIKQIKKQSYYQYEWESRRNPGAQVYQTSLLKANLNPLMLVSLVSPLVPLESAKKVHQNQEPFELASPEVHYWVFRRQPHSVTYSINKTDESTFKKVQSQFKILNNTKPATNSLQSKNVTVPSNTLQSKAAGSVTPTNNTLSVPTQPRSSITTPQTKSMGSMQWHVVKGHELGRFNTITNNDYKNYWPVSWNVKQDRMSAFKQSRSRLQPILGDQVMVSAIDSYISKDNNRDEFPEPAYEMEWDVLRNKGGGILAFKTTLAKDGLKKSSNDISTPLRVKEKQQTVSSISVKSAVKKDVQPQTSNKNISIDSNYQNNSNKKSSKVIYLDEDTNKNTGMQWTVSKVPRSKQFKTLPANSIDLDQSQTDSQKKKKKTLVQISRSEETLVLRGPESSKNLVNRASSNKNTVDYSLPLGQAPTNSKVVTAETATFSPDYSLPIGSNDSPFVKVHHQPYNIPAPSNLHTVKPHTTQQPEKKSQVTIPKLFKRNIKSPTSSFTNEPIDELGDLQNMVEAPSLKRKKSSEQVGITLAGKLDTTKHDYSYRSFEYTPNTPPSSATDLNRQDDPKWYDPVRYDKRYENGQIYYYLKENRNSPNMTVQTQSTNQVVTKKIETPQMAISNYYINNPPIVPQQTISKGINLTVANTSPSHQSLHSKVTIHDGSSSVAVLGNNQVLPTSSRVRDSLIDQEGYQKRIQGGVAIYSRIKDNNPEQQYTNRPSSGATSHASSRNQRVLIQGSSPNYMKIESTSNRTEPHYTSMTSRTNSYPYVGSSTDNKKIDVASNKTSFSNTGNEYFYAGPSSKNIDQSRTNILAQDYNPSRKDIKPYSVDSKLDAVQDSCLFVLPDTQAHIKRSLYPIMGPRDKMQTYSSQDGLKYVKFNQYSKVYLILSDQSKTPPLLQSNVIFVKTNSPAYGNRQIILKDLELQRARGNKVTSVYEGKTEKPELLNSVSTKELASNQTIKATANTTPLLGQQYQIIIKKMNPLIQEICNLVFPSQSDKILKYYTTSELLSISKRINPTQPVLLISDDIPEAIDLFKELPYFQCIILPKGKMFQSQQAKYSQYKWISQENPKKAAEDIQKYLQFKRLGTARTVVSPTTQNILTSSRDKLSTNLLISEQLRSILPLGSLSKYEFFNRQDIKYKIKSDNKNIIVMTPGDYNAVVGSKKVGDKLLFLLRDGESEFGLPQVDLCTRKASEIISYVDKTTGFSQSTARRLSVVCHSDDSEVRQTFEKLYANKINIAQYRDRTSLLRCLDQIISPPVIVVLNSLLAKDTLDFKLHRNQPKLIVWDKNRRVPMSARDLDLQLCTSAKELAVCVNSLQLM